MAMPLTVPTYTTDDLREFPPDGQRYELVEGTLLVTPAPTTLHQVLLARLMERLRHYLPEGGPAWVVSPGEIEIRPQTLMDPDILVYPSAYHPGTPWTEITGWWLAIEVYNPSSRVYDHDFKGPTYLALGVRETWMIDPREETIAVAHRGARENTVRERLHWRPPECAEPFELELAWLFRGNA